MAVFLSVWKLVTSPIGIALAIALAFLTTYQMGKHKGYSNCKTEWVAANAAADLAKKKREAEIARTLQAMAQQTEAYLALEKKKFEEVLGEYEAELAKKPDNRCLLDDADIRRLRPRR